MSATPGNGSTFVRFAVTGAFTGLSYLGLALAINAVLVDAVLASFAAYCIVILLHFLLSNFFTFKREGVTVGVVLRYAAFAATFALVNFAVAEVVRRFGFHSAYLFVANMLISPLLSFVVMKTFVFAK